MIPEGKRGGLRKKQGLHCITLAKKNFVQT